MFWMIASLVIGLIVGIVFWIKKKTFAAMLASVTICIIIGLLITLLCTGILHSVMPESAYQIIEVQNDDIALSNDGNIVFFQISTSGNKCYVNYLTDDNRVVNKALHDWNVEFVDSNYRVVSSQEHLKYWYDIFVTPKSHPVTIYISEEAWTNAWKS